MEVKTDNVRAFEEARNMRIEEEDPLFIRGRAEQLKELEQTAQSRLIKATGLLLPLLTELIGLDPNLVEVLRSGKLHQYYVLRGGGNLSIARSVVECRWGYEMDEEYKSRRVQYRKWHEKFIGSFPFVLTTTKDISEIKIAIRSHTLSVDEDVDDKGVPNPGISTVEFIDDPAKIIPSLERGFSKPTRQQEQLII